MMSLEEIEEMTSICEQYCKDCPHSQRKTEGNCYFSRSVCWSAALYAAGYRKADEVRKETAKEILERYKDLANEEEICVEMLDLLNDDIGYDYGIESEDILREEPEGK